MAQSLQIASLFATADLRDNLTPALDNAEKQLSGFASNLGKKMTDIGQKMTVGLTLPVVGFLAASMKAADESDAAIAQLNAVLKSTKGAAGVTTAAAVKLASQLQKVTKFSDEEVLSAENMLLTFTKINKDIFPDTTRLALDMSTALGQDLKSSAIQLGKALNDPIQGVTALRRVGVAFTDQQMAQIKAMQESGNLLGAQKLIMKELFTEFGGSAEAAAKTAGGAIAQMMNQINDLMENVGKTLQPIIAPIIASISDFVAKLQDLNPDVLRLGVVAGIAVAALGPLLTVIGNLGKAIGLLLSPAGLLIAAIVVIGALAIQHFGGLDKLLQAATQSAQQLVAIIMFGLTTAAATAGNIGKIALFGIFDGLSKAATAATQLGFIFMFGLSTAARAASQLVVIGVNAIKTAVQAVVNLVQSLIDKFNTLALVAKALPGYLAGKQTSEAQGGLFLNGKDVGANNKSSSPGLRGGSAFGSFGFGGGRAAGGSVMAGRSYMVGERGPELLTMGGRGGNITPNGGGGPSTITVVLKADGFEDHIVVNIANAIRAGRMA